MKPTVAIALVIVVANTFILFGTLFYIASRVEPAPILFALLILQAVCLVVNINTLHRLLG